MADIKGEKKTNVLLFGLGAIGGFYAFILGKHPNISLSVVARSNYDAVKQNGLRLQSQIHGDHTAQLDHVFNSISEIPDSPAFKFDYIVCVNKAINIASTPPLFRKCTTANTTFVLIQNGVGNEDPFRDTYPSNTIISCVCWTGAVQRTPGLIEQGYNEGLEIGLFPNLTLANSTLEQTRLQTFADLLTTAGTTVTTFDNIQPKRWEKVIWNAAWNPLTALTSLSVQTYLRSTPDAIDTAKTLMREVLLVARTLGVPDLRDSLPDELVDKVLGFRNEIYPSMYEDRLAGRRLEKEVILGVPMRRARELGLEDRVPVLKAIWSMIDAVDLSFAQG